MAKQKKKVKDFPPATRKSASPEPLSLLVKCAAAIIVVAVIGIIAALTITAVASPLVQIFHEPSKSGSGVSIQTDAEHKFLTAKPTSKMAVAGTQTKYFYTFDHLGSVRELTDETGTVQSAYQYDPYGQQTKFQSGTVDADFAYADVYMHRRSGLLFMGNRVYSPKLGRFLTRDPIEEAGGINLYGYANNNPISLTDRDGLAPDIKIDGTVWRAPGTQGDANTIRTSPPNCPQNPVPGKPWPKYPYPNGSAREYNSAGNPIDIRTSLPGNKNDSHNPILPGYYK
ncbi:MAG: hypothetical protein K2X29_12550 [Candidatus Obscuribacterales bacterium]|nr:hypothetical protein [Candidatus Obscuribacterales bacterium]